MAQTDRSHRPTGGIPRVLSLAAVARAGIRRLQQLRLEHGAVGGRIGGRVYRCLRGGLGRRADRSASA